MRFQLESPSYIFDTVLDEGTIIGDDTMYPLYEGFAPGANMKPLDSEAEALSKKTGEGKQNWGRPEENLETRISSGDHHPVSGSTTNRPNQPTIPPPMEHLISPNDRRPEHGLSPRPSPIVTEMVRKENERIAAENDKRMAEQANAQAENKFQSGLPKGVEIRNSGAQNKAQGNLPGQGPPSKPSSAPGQGANAPSKQVPRDTQGLTPTSEDGQFKKPDEKK